MRVTVIRHKQGRIIKVCEDRQTARTWLAHSEWSQSETRMMNCNVTEWEDIA
jgi:hypothetical protein